MFRHCSHVAVTVAVLFVSTRLHAAIILNSHNRFVDASISIPADSEHKTATGAGPFSETATAEVVFSGETSRTVASQTSSFGVLGNTLTAAGSVHGRMETRTLPNSIASADSRFELQFTLDAPGTYSLTGTGRVFGSFSEPGFYGSYIVNLNGPGGTIFDHRDESLAGVFNETFNDTGALAPGTYTFIARGLSGGVGGVTEGGEADFTFIVDAPGGGTPAVPLPAALWVGTTMGTYVMARRRR